MVFDPSPPPLPVTKTYVCVSIKWNIQQLKETYKRDLQKRPTRETYKRDLQKRPTKETYKRDLQQRPTKKRCMHSLLKYYVCVSIKWDIQQLKKTYKRDLHKRPTKETHNKTVHAPATERLRVCVNQMRHWTTKRNLQKRPTKRYVNQIRHTATKRDLQKRPTKGTHKKMVQAPAPKRSRVCVNQMRHTATKRALRKRPTKETYKKRPTTKRCRHPLLKDYVCVSIKWDIQQLKETYKRDLQKRPTKNGAGTRY